MFIFGGANNEVEGNLIGTKEDGTTALGNSTDGVLISGSSVGNTVTVGGATPAAANTIAFNVKSGVEVVNGPGSRVLRNSIFSNGGLGIDLVGEKDPPNGAINNDEDGPDDGPNNLQNKPNLISAETVSGKTTIQGKLNSTPFSSFTVQMFSNPGGKVGKKFIGQKSVDTNGRGKASFALSPAKSVAVGQTITATTTSNFQGNTSEFSAPRKVAAS